MTTATGRCQANRLQVYALAYYLTSFLRTAASLEVIERRSLSSRKTCPYALDRAPKQR